MNAPRLTIKEVAVVDGGMPPATISFEEGLNVVVGASDTGKTFIFEALDFMLGARGPLRRIPEAAGYTSVLLLVDPSDGPPVTFQRGFGGGEFSAVEFAKGRDAEATARMMLSATHNADPNRSLSAYLLRLVGLLGREIRKNSSGVKQSLSFRNVCHLTLIDEERIIKQGSPVVTGQYTSKTIEENVFALLLTGTDDSTVVPGEKKPQRDARLAIQEDIVESLLEEKRRDLSSLEIGDVRLTDEAVRLDAAIEHAAQRVVVSQSDIETHARQRDEAIAVRTQCQSRLDFVSQQADRLRLLQEYYKTDYARLETMVQASQAFHVLPEGSCPFCNRAYEADATSLGHQEFESACAAEMRKIEVLRRDLALAIGDFDSETTQLREELARLNGELADMQSRLEKILAPANSTSQVALDALIGRRTLIARGLALQDAIDGLELRLERIQVERSQKPNKQVFERRTTTSSMTAFCSVVEEILGAWKYPNLGRVTFDPQKEDLVIGGQDRANKGKGYRAITHAAFAIGLMTFCRRNQLPHPGFVILDTPLNPFKGPAPVTADERLSDEVKVAFFEYLANEIVEDQVIIMENEEPPERTKSLMTYHRFTKNTEIDRYGFFPVRA